MISFLDHLHERDTHCSRSSYKPKQYYDKNHFAGDEYQMSALCYKWDCNYTLYNKHRAGHFCEFIKDGVIDELT